MKTRRGADFLLGVRLLGRGLRLYGGSPGLLLLGMIPAVISTTIVLIAFVVLVIFVEDLAELVTWFADDWSGGTRTLVRVLAGAVILAVAAFVSVLTYTALTLVIGDPFYEVISERLEGRLGGTPDVIDVPWYRSARRNLADSLRLIGFSLLVSIPVFAIGFIPVVGQIAVFVINMLVGGWVLALELTGIPFNRRGRRLADRRRLLRANRSLALGLGIPVFLLMLVPFVGIFVMPIAVAGGTLLSRHVLGHPTTPVPASTGAQGGQ